MLDLNGIQHFVFCKRQWALIALEAAWAENADTMLGRFVHERVDDPYYEEKRKDKLIVRAMPIVSHKLGFIGKCDAVEFVKSKEGVPIRNYDGLWKINVVEYKKGKPKRDLSDVSQLVAQAMSLEEMFHTRINRSAIYYKGDNSRTAVDITDELRNTVAATAAEMNRLYGMRTTPKAEFSSKCKRCSLREKCMPRLTGRKRSVVNYVAQHMEEICENS
ncbi:MAG: CRISPR-associated protein Cas4 [Acidaminococcaceae bacterium]|nr:CRISPR-associated protein Cas4 [Acidaminococcaceae bacterium]